MTRARVRGEVFVAIAAALWALIGVCTRELGELGMPAADVGAWRALVGGGCFALHALVARRRGSTATAAPRAPAGTGSPGVSVATGSPGVSVATAGALRRRWVGIVAFCVVGVVVFYASLPLAVASGGISLAYVLLYTAPIWVTLGAVTVLGERLEAGQVVAVVVTVAGVCALAASAGGTVTVSVRSVGWGLVAGISYASYYLLGRRLFEAVAPTLVYAIVLPAGGLVLALTVGAGRPAGGSLPWLLLLGVGSTYLPYLLFGIGVMRIASSRAVVVAMVEPVLAAAIGVGFYGERLGVLGVVGGVSVVLAATVVALRGNR